MKIVLFYHSLVSDWNHGNAHFLRGMYRELKRRGHHLICLEQEHNWSLENLINGHGQQAVDNFHQRFPDLKPEFYNPADFDPAQYLRDADLVIVHEWNDPELVKQIGDYRRLYDFTLLFHDTHHRAISAPDEMHRYDLSHYDGVLAFGKTLAEVYENTGWTNKVWTFHEAADTTTYFPQAAAKKEGDLVWIGNWGDEERTAELKEFIIEPVKKLGLKAKFYGVRYPNHALESLADAGIEYGGWLPAHNVAATFAKYRFTVHVPRKFYRDHLIGIPTIRPFEAMACKIPLLSAPWQDAEHLFGSDDFLMAANGEEMAAQMEYVVNNPEAAASMTERAYHTILEKHTCRQRADQLLEIYESIKSGTPVKINQ